MSVIVPITRRDYVRRSSLALVPLPPQSSFAPLFTQAAARAGIDPDAVTWGRGVMLVAPLTAEFGREIAVHARLDNSKDEGERLVTLFAPGNIAPPVTVRFGSGEGAVPVSLTFRLLRSQVVAAVVRRDGGPALGVTAELRLL